jgi:hypothetical protein
MSKINTLLSKAMSTSSEEEAIACLRMARKHGSSVEGSFEDKQPKLDVDRTKATIAALMNLYQHEAAGRQLALQRLRQTTEKLHLEIAKPKLTLAGAVVLMIVGYIIAVFIIAL